MGSLSLIHSLLALILVVAIIYIVFKAVAGAASGKGGASSDNINFIKVGSRSEAIDKVTALASQGYSIIMDADNKIVLAKKVPFNWVLGIVLLFIPIIGWISLGYMLFANKGKTKTASIEIV